MQDVKSEIKKINKTSIFNITAVWELDGQYYKRDFCLCARSMDRAKEKIMQMFSSLKTRPQLAVEPKAIKTDSSIETILFSTTPEAINKPPEETDKLLPIITAFSSFWGQELGWRRTASNLSDEDILCRDKLADETSRDICVANWADEYINLEQTPDKTSFFIKKLSEYIGFNISDIDTMSPIEDGAYARLIKDAQTEAQKIIDTAEQTAAEKNKAVDSLMETMKGIVDDFETILSTGNITVTQQQTAAIPDDLPTEAEDEGEVEPDYDADTDYNANASSEQTDNTASEVKDIPDSPINKINQEQAEQSEQIPDANAAAQETIGNIASFDNNLSKEQTKETALPSVSKEIMIQTIQHLNMQILINELRNLTALNLDKNKQWHPISAYTIYKDKCMAYGKRIDTCRRQIIINIIQSCMPVGKVTAVKYIYDKYCINMDFNEPFT